MGLIATMGAVAVVVLRCGSGIDWLWLSVVALSGSYSGNIIKTIAEDYVGVIEDTEKKEEKH